MIYFTQLNRLVSNVRDAGCHRLLNFRIEKKIKEHDVIEIRILKLG